jgi:dihydroflavonol-4-reductase
MNFCPVQDVAAGHVLAARRGQPGQRYILGHRNGNLSEKAFLTLLAEVSGLTIPAGRDPLTRGRRPMALTVDPTRAIQELGLPQSDLMAAFGSALAFFQDGPNWLSKAETD